MMVFILAVLEAPVAVAEDTPPPALRYFIDGMVAEMEGDFDRALGSYLIAENIAPDNHEIIRTIGELFMDNGDPQQAIARFARLVDMEPANESYRRGLAEAALRARQILIAYDSFRWIVKNGHPDYGVRLKYVTTSLAMNKEKEALKELDKLTEELPDRPEPFALRANIHMSNRDYDKAVDDFKRTIEIASSFGRAYLGLAAAYDALGETDSSINVQKRYVELNPLDIDSQKRLLFQLIEIERLEEAYDVAGDYIDKFPDDLAVVRQAAFLGFSNENYLEAKGYFEDYLSEEPFDRDARLFYGRTLFELGMIEESIAQYKNVASQERRLDVLIDLALAYSEIDSLGKSKAILEEAEKAFPEEPSVIFYRGVVHSREGDYEKAAESYTHVLDNNPQNTQALFGLGDAFERLGERDSARVIFKRLTAVFPGDPLSANYLAYLLIEDERELDLADSLVEMALTIDPRNAAYVDSHGWLLYKQGHLLKALEQLLLAESLSDPDDPVILEHIGIIYEETGDIDAAMRYYRRAVEIDPSMEISSFRLKELDK